MKILILNYEYPPIGGGAGNQTELLSKEFVNKGHSIKIITSHFKGLPFYEKKENGLEIVRVPVFRENLDRSNYFQMLMYLIMAFFPLIWICLKWKPTVIFSFFLLPTSILAYIQKFFFKIPYIVSLRGGDVPSFVPEEINTPEILKKIGNAIGKKSEVLVAVSKDLKNMAQKDFPELSSKIININNGIKVKQVKRDLKEKTTFLFVGRLTKQKNIDFMIDCLKDVNEDYLFNIIGDGPLKVKLLSIVKKYGLENKIIFKGWLDRKDIFKEMSSSHFLVLLSEIEGLSNSGLEAYSFGLPIIASNSSGVRDFVIDGTTGYLIDNNNGKQLRSVIDKILNNSEISKNMSDNCLKFVDENYNISNCADEYLELFDRNKINLSVTRR